MKNIRLVVNNEINREKEKFFIRKELQCILNLYAKMVSNGSWKDYSFSSGSKEVSFDIYQRASDLPVLRILKNLKPNLTIVLKANFETINSRIKMRKNNNKFDKLKTNFYKKAQNAYLMLAKKNKNYLVFDSSKNTTELEKKIFSVVLDNIK